MEFVQAHAGGIKLTAKMVEDFSAIYMAPRYDTARPTPPFHREVWETYCSDVPSAAVAAPRSHAKTTAFTVDFILANALFGTEDYIMILGASEEMASEHLQNISYELHENDWIKDTPEFAIRKWHTDQKTELMIELKDGRMFRIVARGAEQKIRGRLWKGKRPGLIVCDDLETDDQVANKDTREKFRQWFFRAVKQCMRDGGRIRVHGTIMDDDSLLMRLMRNKQWKSHLYKAHEGFDDFSNILWPEKFSEERLRGIRQELIEEGDAAGYSQEYLNDPIDNSQQYFRKDDFLPMTDDDFHSPKKYVIGLDFAFTVDTRNDKCAFVVGGLDMNNDINVVFSRAEHWDSMTSIAYLFELDDEYHPEFFIVEGGQGAQAIMPMIEHEMRLRNQWISIVVMPSMGDKRRRASALQKRMRAAAVKWNKECDDYQTLEAEYRKFTGHQKNGKDDRVDAGAWMAHGCLKINELTPEDFEAEDEFELPPEMTGRSTVSGY